MSATAAPAILAADVQTPAERRPVRIRTTEAAVRARVSVETVRRWVKAGRLTAYRLGLRTVLVDMDELDQLIESQKVPAAAAG